MNVLGKMSVLWNKKRRIFYMLCFAFAFFIDQRTKTTSGLDGLQESFRDLTGVVMALLIISHYRLSDIKKWKGPHLVWTIIWAVGVIPAFLWGRENRPFLNDWCVIIIDIILWGYILIHTFISVVLEKKYPKLNGKFALAWTVMMLLMIVSRSDYIWPFAYLVMFACFYLTDYSAEEREDLFQGILDGAILAFFLMQGWCFVFRPYDVVRYIGVYSNTNINGLFYLEVLAAVFAKLIYAYRNQANKWLKFYYWLGIGTVLSFLFMTVGRTAWLTAFAMGLVFLACLKLAQQRKRFILNGMIMILCAVLTFPLCFGAARYLPPLFHHPVWHWGEWSEDKVHSWDPWNSEKYIDLDELMEVALGRIAEIGKQFFAYSPLTLSVEAAEIDDGAEKATEVDDRAERALLTQEQYSDAILVRKTIYEQYFTKLNLWGHPYEEQGFQLTPTYWIGHAHNIYLQYGTDFGIIVLGLFICLIIWSVIYFVQKIRRQCMEPHAACLFFLMVPTVFGFLEYSWGVGSITILLLFVVWRKVICNEE